MKSGNAAGIGVAVTLPVSAVKWLLMSLLPAITPNRRR